MNEPLETFGTQMTNFIDSEAIFDQIDASLTSAYVRWRQGSGDLEPRNDKIFHYTDAAGLIGIVTNGTLWLSNADFLNDSSEPHYAFAVLENSIRQLSQSASPGSLAARVLDGFWTWVVNEYQVQGPHVYVFCLSEHSDLLSQWRSYGSHGAGFAVGFSQRKLGGVLDPSLGQYLVKVVYSEGEQRTEAKSVFASILGILDDAEREFGPINQATMGDYAPRIENKLRSSLFSEIVRLRSKFKSPGFSEEGEWRVTQFMHPSVEEPNVLFRPGTATIKPFIELDFGHNKLPVEETTVGPTIISESSQRAVRLLFAKHHYGSVVVNPSAVPFRV